MKILIASSLELPYTKDARFTGLERIAVMFANELNRLGHDITILAYKDTWVDEGVKLFPCELKSNLHAEIRGFQLYSGELQNFDVIHDIGHLHLPARYMPFLPTVSVLNHAPVHAQYPKAPYNIISWSKWGVWAFRKYYKQEARYQETIAIDPKEYYPKGERGDRFLTIGRMSPDKGNLNTAMLCEHLELPLDIVGGRGSEFSKDDPLTPYELKCREIADGEKIRFLGEVTDAEKIKLMQTCKALLYVTDHTEITSHKVQESIFCGSPVVIPLLGGLPEIVVSNGLDGYCCKSEQDYIEAIKSVDSLTPDLVHKQQVGKYCVENVVGNYVKLYQEVADGLRWK